MVQNATLLDEAQRVPGFRRKLVASYILPSLSRGGGPHEVRWRGASEASFFVCLDQEEERLCRCPSTVLRTVPLPCKGRGGIRGLSRLRPASRRRISRTCLPRPYVRRRRRGCPSCG